MLRICNQCKLAKEYNQQAATYKLIGFHRTICWDCYKENQCNNPKKQAASLAWVKRNPGQHNANSARYMTGKDQRTPPWANLDVIRQIYIYASELGLTVDHIVPLHGATVSGLHVENNLQLLTKAENSQKSNSHKEN